jgi:hypothetical protein
VIARPRKGAPSSLFVAQFTVPGGQMNPGQRRGRALPESERSMYTIELTQGSGWDAPTMQAQAIRTTVDLAKVASLAASWLREVRQTASDDAERPDGWRVVDGIGRRIKTSEA